MKATHGVEQSDALAGIRRIHAREKFQERRFIRRPGLARELRKDGIRVTRKTIESLVRKAGIRGAQNRRCRLTTASTKTLH